MEGGVPSQLIYHHIHHLCQLKSFDEVNNYQIVALTTLWSFLAHEVAQNLILEDLMCVCGGGENRDYAGLRNILNQTKQLYLLQ